MTVPGGSTGDTRLSVVVLAYGDEPLLLECVTALLGSPGATPEVLLVDNGCPSDVISQAAELDGVRVLTPGRNTGFTGGCNLGARHATGDVLVFVNSDCVVRPRTLSALAAALADPRLGIAAGSLRLRDRPHLVNSAGNPVHYLGLSWAGGLGQPAAELEHRRPVASASGGLMALRSTTWTDLGGFFEPMFAYGEDVELSLRCWQRGWTVELVPDAVADHAYEFHRNPLKMYLLERNRLLTLLTTYEARTLRMLALPLLALELAVLAVAIRQGWWRQKLRGWWWVATHQRSLRRRRRVVQAGRRHTDRVLVPLLTATFDPGEETGFTAPSVLAVASSLLWAVLSRRIG